MTGSTADIVAIVIVALICLTFMLSGIYYADSHPGWRGQQGAPQLQGFTREEYEEVVRAAYGSVPAQREGVAGSQGEGVAGSQGEGSVPGPRGEQAPALHETERR